MKHQYGLEKVRTTSERAGKSINRMACLFEAGVPMEVIAAETGLSTSACQAAVHINGRCKTKPVISAARTEKVIAEQKGLETWATTQTDAIIVVAGADNVGEEEDAVTCATLHVNF